MTSRKLGLSDDKEPASTGRWYPSGRINVCVQGAKKVPWASGRKLVFIYDEVKNEIRMKPLEYK
jgi:hypothetical protein